MRSCDEVMMAVLKPFVNLHLYELDNLQDIKFI